MPVSRQDPEAKDITTAVHGALQGSVLLDAFPKAIVDVQILIVEGQGGMPYSDVWDIAVDPLVCLNACLLSRRWVALFAPYP